MYSLNMSLQSLCLCKRIVRALYVTAMKQPSLLCFSKLLYYEWLQIDKDDQLDNMHHCNDIEDAFVREELG